MMTTAMSLLSVQWLMSSAGCLATGWLAWLVLNGAAQLWPALSMRRAVWLAAQGVVVAAALLPFLPQSPRVASPIELGSTPVAAHIERNTAPVDTITIAAAPAPADIQPASPAIDAPAASSVAARALPLVGMLWLLVYAAGMAWSIFKQLRARRVWRGLLAAAQRLSPAALQANAGFTAEQRSLIARRRLTVMRVDANISPMLVGVLQPVLLLPARLDKLTTEQQQMIVAHELHHWRARDPLCLAIAALLQTLFWFNPTLRWMARQMEWALELQCDQHVLTGRPQHQRKQYAASLMQQWSAPMGIAAFNGATITARIRHMQKGSLPALTNAAAWTTATALIAVLAAGVMLQPALAFSTSRTAEASTVTMAATTSTEATSNWRAPLDNIRVTSFFGVKRTLPRTPHKGVDFGAAKGTPVHATASGIIIAAGPIAENDGKYGNTVIIEHGAQRSLYAHLDRVNVKPGQRVQAGQLIGAVGETGLATGPHLHLEVRQDGRNVDPATLLTNLDAYATARALKVRRQQLPSKG